MISQTKKSANHSILYYFSINIYIWSLALYFFIYSIVSKPVEAPEHEHEKKPGFLNIMNTQNYEFV
jgi:hypothetical protein